MLQILRGLAELLLPLRCSACGSGRPTTALGVCRACTARLPLLSAEEALRVASVRTLDACVAAIAYAGAIDSWMHRFKYPPAGLGGLDPAPAALVRGLARHAACLAPGPAPDLVVPVPLHSARLIQRGFNPAALVAREVARTVRSPLSVRTLERTRDTPSQTGLDRHARRRNVAGAFRARTSVPARIWLVDDVVTTGSTLLEAARGLRRAGAERVVGVCVAATPAGQ